MTFVLNFFCSFFNLKNIRKLIFNFRINVSIEDFIEMFQLLDPNRIVVVSKERLWRF